MSVFFNSQSFFNRNISCHSRYHRTLDSGSCINWTIPLLATLSREHPRKPRISVLFVYTSPTVEALDLDPCKWTHRCNSHDWFHKLGCVRFLVFLGTGSPLLPFSADRIVLLIRLRLSSITRTTCTTLQCKVLFVSYLCPCRELRAT